MYFSCDASNFNGHRRTSQDNTELVSTVAYLIGVPKRIFENVNESPKLDIYQKLESDKNARIIRNLCIIRTEIERNYKSIHEAMRFEYRSILNIPEYIPEASIRSLSADGICFVKKSSTKLYHHIIEINRIICDRINNCKHLFPLWLNWDYIRDLFIMPNGLSEKGTKQASEIYYENLSCYPYQMYINWVPQDKGNILHHDSKFVKLLYQIHDDYFTEYSKVSDADDHIKVNIYDFIDASEKVVVVVDCENSDPYKLCATLRNLNREFTRKITKIILFDDIHTTVTWSILEQYMDIPIEYLLTERIKGNKSLVDITLTARACKEHYKNDVDAFILVSSDSDYWGLISSLPEARFLVMIEQENCGPDLKEALINSGIFYCYIDDFYSGNAEDLKHGALVREMSRYIKNNMKFNVNTMFDEALRTTRVNMKESEKKQFYDRYIKTLKLSIDEIGNITVEFKHK